MIVGQNIQCQNVRDHIGFDIIVIPHSPFRAASVIHMAVGKHAIPKADRRLTLKELPHGRIEVGSNIIR